MITEEIKSEIKCDSMRQDLLPQSHIKILKVWENHVTIFHILIYVFDDF